MYVFCNSVLGVPVIYVYIKCFRSLMGPFFILSRKNDPISLRNLGYVVYGVLNIQTIILLRKFAF